MSRTFEVGEFSYTHTKLNTIEQWKAARIAAPMFEGKAQFTWISIFYQMSERDFDALFELVMPKAQRLVGNSKVSIWGNGNTVFPDITGGQLVTILVEILVDYLPDFLKDVSAMESPTSNATVPEKE